MPPAFAPHGLSGAGAIQRGGGGGPAGIATATPLVLGVLDCDDLARGDEAPKGVGTL